MQIEVKEFGARVAGLSPQLALGFGGAAVVTWALIPAPMELWLGDLTLGLLAGLVVVRFYKTGDGMYVLPYAVLLGMFPLVNTFTIGSFDVAPTLGGLMTLLTGISLAIALRRRSVLEASGGDA